MTALQVLQVRHIQYGVFFFLGVDRQIEQVLYTYTGVMLLCAPVP